MAVIAGIPLLVGSAIQRQNEYSLAGTIIFAMAMVCLYLASTIYHAATSRAGSKSSSICLIIRRFTFSSPAPIPLSLWEPCAVVWGWTLFGVVWSLGDPRYDFQSLWRIEISTALDSDLPRHGMDGPCWQFVFFGSMSSSRDCSGFLPEELPILQGSSFTPRNGFRTTTSSGICL